MFFRVLLKKYGKAHVLQSYENGNPQVAVFPEDREFADGAQAKANTPISYAENGQIVGFTLNRDWQSPNGLWARAGSWLAYFEENARIESCTLDRDWQSPAGLWLKDGTRVEYFENGQLSRATLAKDWKSPKGKLIKAGTELKFSKDGKVKKSSSE
jgi:antitoxin component YwqK of YwqJK toxin-antitoxin module